MKIIYGIRILLEKNKYFILFYLESYFYDKQSGFSILRLYWNKKVKRRFIYEQKLKSSE